MVIAFQPTDGATSSISGTTTSANKQVATGSHGARIQLRIVNSGTTAAFIKFGSDNTVIATASDIPVLGGQEVVWSANIPLDGTLWMAAIMASGTATIYATVGVGIR